MVFYEIMKEKITFTVLSTEHSSFYFQKEYCMVEMLREAHENYVLPIKPLSTCTNR